jgi:ATP phosphoribosyltransferase
VLTVALPKGRVLEELMPLFAKAGYPFSHDLFTSSRKLVFTLPEQGFTFFLAKPMDVPTYVEYGVADVGIVGKDVLLEAGREVYELLDLKISPCRLSVAGKPGVEPALYPRVATKYPRIAERYFKERGQQVEVIFLNGSVELAPLTGLAERIVDIVSTGRTLAENGLVELEQITTVTARLIANQVSYRLKRNSIQSLTEQLRQAVERGVSV